MKKWGIWLEDLGDAAINPGTPLGKSKIVSASGISDYGGPDAMSGYTVVEANSMEEAIEMAKACPFLETGGTLEVAQMMQMK